MLGEGGIWQRLAMSGLIYTGNFRPARSGSRKFADVNETISTNFTDPKELDEFYSRVPETDTKLEEFGRRCLKSENGPYLKYVGTSSTIRDLVSLADKIVGPKQPIDYYGYSYGTVIGFHFLSRESDDPLCLGR